MTNLPCLMLAISECIRYDGTNERDIEGFLGEEVSYREVWAPGYFRINLPSGEVTVNTGDWLVKLTNGKIIPFTAKELFGK